MNEISIVIFLRSTITVIFLHGAITVVMSVSYFFFCSLHIALPHSELTIPEYLNVVASAQLIILKVSYGDDF